MCKNTKKMEIKMVNTKINITQFNIIEENDFKVKDTYNIEMTNNLLIVNSE